MKTDKATCPFPRTSDHVLPDLLQPGLAVVFCGTAAGARSAREGAYYAHPGNLFWRTLFATGLTPRQLAPAEFPLINGFGIGLTDLAKFHYGNDDQLPRDAFDVDALKQRIARVGPRVLAFTSKHAGRAALGGKIDYGLQATTWGATRLFVLPSPSGQARGAWNVATWHDLARLVGAQPPGTER